MKILGNAFKILPTVSSHQPKDTFHICASFAVQLLAAFQYKLPGCCEPRKDVPVSRRVTGSLCNSPLLCISFLCQQLPTNQFYNCQQFYTCL